MSIDRRLILAMVGFAIPVIMFMFAFVSAAQNGSAHAVPSRALYHELFPIPTGNNGYEEFVKAEDLFTSSPTFLESERLDGDQSATTVDAKRKLISDPTVQQVLSLMRTGLKKRVHSPRPTPELYTLTPELRDFRAIARLMCAEMEVQFADGKTSEAIDCLGDALVFGRDVQVGTLLSGVVGLYIENTALQDFADHFAWLSVSECDRLAGVTRRHLDGADPQIALLSSERDMFLRTLKHNRNDASALLDKLDPGPNTAKSLRVGFTEVCRLAKDDPNAGDVMLDKAGQLVSAHFARLIQEIRRPLWERRLQQPTDISTPESKMVFSLFPANYSLLNNRFAGERLEVQMLAMEASLIRNLRRSGHLPYSLVELKQASLMTDPFSGQPLGYERSGIDAFTISSVGPYATDDSKNIPSITRSPITVAFPPHR